jgi:hypothetical protein
LKSSAFSSKLLSGSVPVRIGEQGVRSRVSSGMMPAEPTNEGTPLVAPASTRSRSARAVAEIGERLCLQHTGDTRPLWHVIRITIGVAACLAINKAAQCTDHFSAVFNYFMCVCAFSGSTLLTVQQTLVGGAAGTAVGILFAFLTAAVSTTQEFYADTWHVVWTVPLAMTIVYYGLSVLRLRGPDQVQLISAETSTILLILAPFPYPPIALARGNTKWSLVLQSLVTRGISLVNACIVAVLIRGLGKVLLKVSERVHRRASSPPSFVSISHEKLNVG